jgi:hypothetical protein
MLILNDAHRKHNITYKWKPKQDYSASGSVIYPRGTLVPFKGKINTQKSIISKVFVEGIERKNSSFVIESVAQYPFKKDDIIIDDVGNTYLIVNPIHEVDENQTRFMKSNQLSKLWYLGVEGDE